MFIFFPKEVAKFPVSILEKYVYSFSQLTNTFKCIINYEENYVLAYLFYCILQIMHF